VDPRLAHNAAIESTPSIIHSLLEDFSNCKDYSKEIHIKLYGTYPRPDRPKELLLTKVVFEDDGCGMTHDTVCERFRGSYFDSASHDTHEKSGRNGIGVKTNFKYWQMLELETSTSDNVPDVWTCHPDNVDSITDSWLEVSKLLPGQPDTEKRCYRMTRKDLFFDKVIPCPLETHGTKVTLKNPIGAVKVNIDEFLMRLGHSIEFLDESRHPDHKVVLWYPSPGSGNQTNLVVKAFHQVVKNASHMCEAVCRPGDDQVFINGTGMPQKGVIVPPKSELEDVEIFVRVLETVESGNNQFVMSICGSNVYDESRSEALSKAFNRQRLSSERSFKERIFGYVRCNDPKLKDALRLNRTALDEDDPTVQAFFEHLGNVFRVLNRQFVDMMKIDDTKEDKNTLNIIKERLNLVISSGKGERKEKTDTTHDRKAVQHHRWTCRDCGTDWDVPVLFGRPVSCCEGAADGKPGCGSSRIERRKNNQTSGVDVRWVPFIGNFVPARYDKANNMVELSRSHPDFILRSSANLAVEERLVRGVERALFAIACSEAEDEGKSVEQVYAKLLKKRYDKGSNRAHQRACEKFWREHKIDQKLI